MAKLAGLILPEPPALRRVALFPEVIAWDILVKILAWNFIVGKIELGCGILFDAAVHEIAIVACSAVAFPVELTLRKRLQPRLSLTL